MNIRDYCDPVALDKPANLHLSDKAVLCKNIYINTPDTPLKDLDSYDLAIIGAPEDRNATIAGSAKAPDLIRNELYQLFRVNPKLRIIDPNTINMLFFLIVVCDRIRLKLINNVSLIF